MRVMVDMEAAGLAIKEGILTQASSRRGSLQGLLDGCLVRVILNRQAVELVMKTL